MAVKIEMLRSFCAVAAAGNLADAAAQLGRTQSAVSMTLKQLEQTLGVALFESDRKNRLTAVGQQVLHISQNQLRQFDTTLNALDLLSRAPQGSLRIASVPSVAALAFPPIVRHITTHHPAAKVELRDADTSQVLEALAQGWADIGIASAHQKLNGVSSHKLFSDRFGLVLAETHPLAYVDRPLSINDVIATPFLRNALCDQIGSDDIQRFLNNVDVTVHNTQSLLAMVRQGDWVTLLPRSTMPLAPDGLVFRSVAGVPDARQVYLYVRHQPSSPDIAGEAMEVIRSLDWPANS